MCIAQNPPITEAARINNLEQVEIKIDGSFVDWKGVSPIYEDWEKSLFCVLSNEYLAIRMDFVFLDPKRENYFIEIDYTFDEIADIHIEFKGKEKTLSVKKKGFRKFKEIDTDSKCAVTGCIEMTLPVALIDSPGFFITGWVYDTSLENVTAHFPWVRSLYSETEFDPDTLTKNEWKEDFEAFYYLVKLNYPYIWVKERTHGFNWLDLKDDYMERLDNIETNEEFFGIMKEAVATIHNGHTHFLLHPLPYYSVGDSIKDAMAYWESMQVYALPEVFFFYQGGCYTAGAGIKTWEEKYEIEKGSTVIAVNGTPVHEAVKSLLYKKGLPLHDRDRDIFFMKYLHPAYFGEEAVFTIENSQGKSVDIHIECMIMDSYEDYIKTWYEIFPKKENIEFKLLEDKKVAYMRIRRFSMETPEELSKLSEFYRTINGYNTLIIDIRGNPGGSDFYWSDNVISHLITGKVSAEYFIAFRQGKYIAWNRNKGIIPSRDTEHTVPSEVNTNNFVLDTLSLSVNPSTNTFQGDVYILVDNTIYSAAEGFAVFCKETKIAQLIGTNTGGDGIGVTPFLFVLPNSKLVIRMAACMGINPDGTANEETQTVPHVYVEWSQFENDEELLQYILDEYIGG
jgi:C-terminal processing protease CtpA/Prc